jgi:hypothetical protein
MSEKIFKGFKQVTAEAFNQAKEANALSGYLWFVRTEVPNEGDTNNVADDKYAIYFGSRQYGYFCEGEIDGIKNSIAGLGENIDVILETLETLTSTLESQGEAIATNKSAHEKNAADITSLTEELAKVLVKNVDSNDKVLNVADGILSAQIGLKYTDGRIVLTGKEGNEITGFDASAFIKDSVLDNVEITEIDGEKYLEFTWKVETEGEDAKVDRIKISEFAKLYTAGTALELDGNDKFNVKVAANDNFLSVNENNELIVDDMTVDKTKIKEDITIEGGPLASDAVKNAFEGGVIPAGTDIQTVLKALLCVEIYPTPTKNNPNYTVSITAPSVTANKTNNATVEIGTNIVINEVVANEVVITPTNPIVSGFDHGYSSTIDGDINKNISISSEWEISQMENNVYELSVSITQGFTNGTAPEKVQNATYSNCKLASFTLPADLGTNEIAITEDAPKHSGSHTGVDSYYIVSNLGGRSEDKKSVSISAQNIDIDPENQTATYKVTGVYPCYCNIKNSAFVNDTEKLALTTGKTFTFSNVPTEVESPNNFMFDYPNTHTISSFKIKDLQGNWVNFSSYFNATSEEITKTINGTDYTYYRLTTGGGNGPAEYQITLNKNLNTK